MYRPNYQHVQSAQTDPGWHIPSHGDRVMIPATENPQEAKGAYPFRLFEMLRLIRVDTLRRVHNVGFFTRRPTHWVLQSYAPDRYPITGYRRLAIFSFQQMTFEHFIKAEETDYSDMLFPSFIHPISKSNFHLFTFSITLLKSHKLWNCNVFRSCFMLRKWLDGARLQYV